MLVFSFRLVAEFKNLKLFILIFHQYKNISGNRRFGSSLCYQLYYDMIMNWHPEMLFYRYNYIQGPVKIPPLTTHS